MKTNLKWKTEPDFALKKAKRLNKKLPEEVEKLFEGSFFYCIKYAKILKSRVSDSLESSLAEELKKENIEYRIAINSIITYSKFAKKISFDLENSFFELIKKIYNSQKDRLDPSNAWLANRLIAYASETEKALPEDLEKIIWQHKDSAFSYITLFNKKVPSEWEEEVFNSFEPDEIIHYAISFFQGRLPENLEFLLLNDMEKCYVYSKEICFGKLPEKMHNALLLKSFEDFKEKEIFRLYMKLIKRSHNYTINVLSGFDKQTTIEDVLKSLGKMHYE